MQIILKHTVNTLQSRLEMRYNHDMKQTTNVEKQMTLKTELEGQKNLHVMLLIPKHLQMQWKKLF